MGLLELIAEPQIQAESYSLVREPGGYGFMLPSAPLPESVARLGRPLIEFSISPFV